jgi:hypothetical protein
MFKVDNSVSLNDFDTISQYIKWLCKRKGITIKKMCDDTGYMYNTIAGNYKYQYLSRQVLVDVINYLEGDFNIAMNLPYKK